MLENRKYNSPYDFGSYIESVDRVEELTDLDFMPGLSSSDENRIEATAPTLW